MAQHQRSTALVAVLVVASAQMAAAAVDLYQSFESGSVSSNGFWLATASSMSTSDWSSSVAAHWGTRGLHVNVTQARNGIDVLLQVRCRGCAGLFLLLCGARVP